MPTSIIEECATLLARKGLSIAFAESATAGRAAAEFSLTSESGKILKGGLVCYDACIKQTVLQIPVDVIERYTPESAEITRELAHGLKRLISADVYVGITGLTTPGGSETPEKPVGTMFIHILIGDKNIAYKQLFAGTPEEIVLQTIDQLALLIVRDQSQ